MRRPGPNRFAALAAAVAIALALGLVACGGDDGGDGGAGGDAPTATDDTGATTTTTEPDDATETVDQPAKLPKGWTQEINETAGFSIGLPPDWKIRGARGGQGSVLTSPDDLITISVTADRSRGALELPLEEFATRTLEALGSDVVGAARIEDLKPQRAAPFNHTYDAAAIRAVGKSSQTGVIERIIVIVVRREGQAAYVIIARENAETPSGFADRDTVKEIVRTLRGRPPV